MCDTPDDPSDLSRVFDEFVARRQQGESPILNEYCERFPDLAEQLLLHVRLYDALGKASSEPEVCSSVNDLHASTAPARHDPKFAIDLEPDDTHVQRLLEELARSDTTPEEVCRSCPELLPRVRERWRQICRVQAELDAVFPTPCLMTPVSLERPPESSRLPAVPGYEVESVLGRGGMGVVFRARHLRLSRIVALKMTLAGVYAGPLERSRFQREAEAVARLQHRNVVQVYDVGDSDGRPYFTMEYVAGGSLAQKLSGAPQPAREAAALVGALAGAVHVAHQSEVVHRDLKPANVLLTVDGTPKISDFGLARRLDGDGDAGLTWTGTAVGTPSYMAPEQAQGKKDAIGPAVDIYSLGAILYEMLTGRPPFRAESAAATVEQVITRDPVPPSRLNPTVPRDLETICLKCLQKEPLLRYPTSAALADDLNRFLWGEAIAARPDGLLRHLVRRAWRRPALSAAVAVSMMFAFALIGGVFWLFSDRAAVRRTGDQDLSEMVERLRLSAWPQASTPLLRARARLGDRASVEQRRLLDEGTTALELVDKLDAIRLRLAAAVGRDIDFSGCDQECERAFREAGLGTVNEASSVVAERVRQSMIQDALVAGLDHWSAVARDKPRKDWILKVARLSDHDPTGWREKARDPAVRANRLALVKLLETIPVAEQSTSLLLALIAADLPLINLDRLSFLRRVHHSHSSDYWVNLALGVALMTQQKSAEAARYFQAATAISPDIALGHNNLGMAMRYLPAEITWDPLAESIEQLRQATAIEPNSVLYRSNLARVLKLKGRMDEAIEEFQVLLRLEHEVPFTLAELSLCLKSKGHLAEAETSLRRAWTLNPENSQIQNQLRSFLIRWGKTEEARVVWSKALQMMPTNHDAWYGYAELCLFAGNESEFFRARRDLLARFAATTDAGTAERTSRACLLGPATAEELRMAVTLADRAINADRSKNPGAYPYYLFVKGLAEFRQGEFDKAISIMRGAASRALGPAPRLVLAMALFRNGEAAEARRTLAAAVVAHNWRADQVRDQDGWIYHVLRREAEHLIVPKLPEFLAGTYPAQDNDERLALVGLCQFENRYAALAHLYSAAFAADPQLAEDSQHWHRYEAALAAAIAGSGRCADSKSLDEAARRRWRDQGRLWLRADLAKWGKTQTDAFIRSSVKQWLMAWQANADLGCVREPAELAKLGEDERRDWLALWREVADVIKRN